MVKIVPSKWCSACQKIVTSSYVPAFCCWCSADLSKDAILQGFKTLQERAQLIKKLSSNDCLVNPHQIAQMKLF